ncbi:uncharacterized protein PV06_05916 [Exophiala oligosperma]|uniref:Mediator of RNA polymerase II transcription subunit 8 n=1 Tax=Exophiala oligosperma TaxID=215243 RepID=A0A0D2AQX5_9EURO|nr:uncharacterized protein PV06_05916 [Exophiala oligosperma]KIW42356.1 hypothetical protein PV06_05916 [Exophiala oligosperma]
MAALTNDQVRSLDQARQRLLALHTSLIALRSEITTQNQLPSWPSLQTHANLISNNLQQIAAQLSEYQDLFKSTVAFPLPQFPGKERAFILETLLRTKLEPNIEDWIEEGGKIAAGQAKDSHSGLSAQERSALWQWAPGAANREARRQKWGADYTLEEKQRGIATVVTGLQRELIEPPDDEGDDEGDEEEEEEEYEESEEEDEDKMDVELTKSQTTAATSKTTTAISTTPNQMSVDKIHKIMVTGRGLG